MHYFKLTTFGAKIQVSHIHRKVIPLEKIHVHSHIIIKDNIFPTLYPIQMKIAKTSLLVISIKIVPNILSSFQYLMKSKR